MGLASTPVVYSMPVTVDALPTLLNAAMAGRAAWLLSQLAFFSMGSAAIAAAAWAVLGSGHGVRVLLAVASMVRLSRGRERVELRGRCGGES